MKQKPKPAGSSPIFSSILVSDGPTVYEQKAGEAAAYIASSGDLVICLIFPIKNYINIGKSGASLELLVMFTKSAAIN